MKILCFIDSLGSGGAQRQMVELAKGFKERGYDVSLLTYHDSNFFKPELDKHNIAVKTIVEPNYIKRLFKVRRFIRQHNPNVLLSFLDASNFMAIWASFPTKKWKLIVGERNAKPQIQKSIKLMFYKWLYVFSDVVVSNSKQNISIIKKVNPFLKQSKCSVIYNGYDLNFWKPDTANNHNEYFTIVIASRHKFHKNLVGLIEAVNLLNDDDKSKLRIHWYGSKRDNSFSIGFQKIKEYKLEKVFTFFENTTDIKQKMLQADAVGLFSYYEGLPNSLCEGMALGKPIISTNVSDAKYFVTEKNGFLCRPEHTASITKALKSIINTDKSKLKTMGNESRKLAERLFDESIMIDNYLDLIQN